MAETPTPTSTYEVNLTCIFGDCLNCDNSTCYTAVEPLPFFLPPPPPPPPPPPSQNHIAPFLIATVSILGISFLLLSTCTIILRLRFTRRRVGSDSPDNHGGSSINGGDDSDMVVDHPIWHIATIGLQQSVIDSITAFKYKKIDGFFIDGINNDCSVCLTEFEDGDDLRLLPKCSHAFHLNCIDTWLRSHKTCPLCRAPIVNEVQGGSSQFNSSVSNSGEVRVRLNLDEGDGNEGSSNQLRERGVDVLGGLRLPVLEGVKIGEIIRKNRELRIFSDLGENYRFQGLEEGLESVRRSASFNGVGGGALMGSEGSSSEGSSNEEKKIELGKGSNKRGSSMSGLSIKSSSISQSLQKGPVSMKRSLSSSSKFFSFRRTRSQASILPL